MLRRMLSPGAHELGAPTPWRRLKIIAAIEDRPLIPKIVAHLTDAWREQAPRNRLCSAKTRAIDCSPGGRYSPV